MYVYLLFPLRSLPSNRWSQHFLRSAQHIRAHRYVYVLYVFGHGSTVPEIFVVEEVLDHTANGKVLIYLHKYIHTYNKYNIIIFFLLSLSSGTICADHGARLPIALHRLQLSKGVRLVDRYARCDVLLLVQ